MKTPNQHRIFSSCLYFALFFLGGSFWIFIDAVDEWLFRELAFTKGIANDVGAAMKYSIVGFAFLVLWDLGERLVRIERKIQILLDSKDTNNDPPALAPTK